MKEFLTIRKLSVLIGLFALSVLIRLPNLNRPLSKHHEFCTAVSLQIMTVWDQEGIAHVHFNPAMNFKGEANKFINNWASSTGKMIDQEGNYYYVSHAPFAYYLPYAVFKLLHIKPGVLALQVFNMIVHFFSALLIYLITISVLGFSSSTYRTALTTYLAYLFSAATLWFQGNVYMSDMLVTFFFILTIFLYMRWYSTRKIWILIIYLLSVFFMVYTSWLGVFYALGFTLFWIIKARQDRFVLALQFFTWSVVLVTLALIIMQYSAINGFDNYLDQMLNRYEERGSIGTGDSFILLKLKEITLIVKNYLTGFLPFILFLLGGMIYRKFKGIKPDLPLGSHFFIWLSILPVGLLHLVLMNYSGHDFVELYGAPAICILFALSLESFILDKSVQEKTSNYLLISALLVSIGSYYYINRPGEWSWKGERYAVQKEIGEYVKAHTRPEEVVYISGYYPEPQTIFYAGRNIIALDSLEIRNGNIGTAKEMPGVIFLVEGDKVIEEQHLAK